MTPTLQCYVIMCWKINSIKLLDVVCLPWCYSGLTGGSNMVTFGKYQGTEMEFFFLLSVFCFQLKAGDTCAHCWKEIFRKAYARNLLLKHLTCFVLWRGFIIRFVFHFQKTDVACCQWLFFLISCCLSNWTCTCD